MRVLRALRVEQREYSFASSGQGHHSDVAVFADDVELMNMLGAVAWNEDPMQVRICEHCGIPRCRRGGCVAFRSLGNFVAAVPVLKSYAAGADGDEKAEFAAPPFIGKHGTLLIDRAVWMEFSTERRLPSAESFPLLSWAEALILASFEGALDAFSLRYAPFAVNFRNRVLSTDPCLSEKDLCSRAESSAVGTSGIGHAPRPSVRRRTDDVHSRRPLR